MSENDPIPTSPDPLPTSPAQPPGGPAPAGVGAGSAKPPPKPVTPDEFFAALGSGVRWAAVMMLADRQELSAIQIAKALGREFDMVSKHLRILRRAGVVKRKRGEDERTRLYFIAPENRTEPRVLQWGSIRVQLAPRKTES